MNKDLKVSESIEINANADKVWNALTNPKMIKQYLFGTETVTDWKEGSPIIFKGEYEGQEYNDKGHVLEIKQRSLIKYNYWSGFSGLEDVPENYAVITYQIEKLEDDRVKLTWTQEGFMSEDAQQDSQSGLRELLEEIKSLIEKKKIR